VKQLTKPGAERAFQSLDLWLASGDDLKSSWVSLDFRIEIVDESVEVRVEKRRQRLDALSILLRPTDVSLKFLVTAEEFVRVHRKVSVRAVTDQGRDLWEEKPAMSLPHDATS
jgi:hypothetical protein